MHLSGYPGRLAETGFTLVEVVISTAIAALTLSGIIYGYIMSSKRAEWSAYSLAAHSLAVQKLEQCRAAKWDPLGYPAVDDLVNSKFPVEINILDLPTAGTNAVYATNYTTISTISTSPALKMVRVDCVWRFMSQGLFTNTIVTYRAADQ